MESHYLVLGAGDFVLYDWIPSEAAVNGPFTTVTVRHYEALLNVVRAAQEVVNAVEGQEPWIDLEKALAALKAIE